MSANITIIGMGKIGTSAGLALAKHTDQLHRIGHDIRPEAARYAQKIGAVDKISFNLPGSVADADIVLLALPIDQIRETLKYIAHDLKEGTVVMDTSPVKTAVAEWAKALMLPNRHYVGLTPVINPEHMWNDKTGGEAAREDLFEKGMMGIVAPQGTIAAALKLATDLTTLLGAKPMFYDMVEVDSLMAATHLVPQLLAAGIVGATAGQPGWDSGQKVAGAAYAQSSAALGAPDTPEAVAQAAELGKTHVVRVLDNVIRELVELRGYIADGESGDLIKALQSAATARLAWIENRISEDWNEGPPKIDIPTSGEQMRRWVFGRRKNKDG